MLVPESLKLKKIRAQVLRLKLLTLKLEKLKGMSKVLVM